MKNFSFPFLCWLFPVAAWAVYAPIPEQEQGKALTYHVGASVYYDDNIFGAPTAKVDSFVYKVSGGLSYNGSLSDQTFLSLGYDVNNDYVEDRPGNQNLTSHTFDGRIAHAFSSVTNVDFSASYNIAKNPASLLSGLPLNADQSFKRAQADARYITALNQKTGLTVKYRLMDVQYDNPTLATDLDRLENLAGTEISYAFLPETKIIGEYRYQDISYRTAGASKDKTSHYFMAGADYSPGKQLLISSRLGLEDRSRRGGDDASSPYAEVTARYNYGEGSYISTGYTYAIEEASDVGNYTDTNVNRLFVNVQHRLSGTITGSASFTYEPSVLQGRSGVHADIDETSTRLGLGLSWLPTKNWTVSATYDYDNVASDDANRDQSRNRVGVSGRFSF